MEDVHSLYGDLINAYIEFKKFARRNDSLLFEQWKAGGFIVDDDIVSMYPNVWEVYKVLAEKLEDRELENADIDSQEN